MRTLLVSLFVATLAPTVCHADAYNAQRNTVVDRSLRANLAEVKTSLGELRTVSANSDRMASLRKQIRPGDTAGNARLLEQMRSTYADTQRINAAAKVRDRALTDRDLSDIRAFERQTGHRW